MSKSKYRPTADYEYKNYKLYIHHYDVLQKIHAEGEITYRDLFEYTKSIKGKNGHPIKDTVAKGILTWLSRRGYIDMPNRNNRSIVVITEDGIKALQNY